MTTVQSACGEVQISELGSTLSHEHLFINMMQERRGDGLLNDEELLKDELQAFADQGGGSIWELTTAELAPGSTVDSTSTFTAAEGQTRNPQALEAIARISKATGVHILLGTGRYRDPYLSHNVISELGIAGLAEEMVRDLNEGFQGTSTRAALIGEIGADKWFVSAMEEQVFRAAARASGETDALIYTHAARWQVGAEQLAILRDEGVDPSRVIIGHSDTVPSDDYVLSLAAQGVNLGIDTVNTSNDWEVRRRTRLLRKLIDAGYISQIVISHDVCTVSQLAAYGGNGYGYILGGFRAAALAAGIEIEEYDQLLKVNPHRLIRR